MSSFGWILFFLLVPGSTSNQKDTPSDYVYDKENQELKTTLYKRARVSYPSRHRRCYVGITFRQPGYTFVVVNHFTTGIIGRVKATSRTGLPIKYKLVSKHPYVNLDSNYGTIKITYKNSALSFSRPMITTAFRVAARSQNACYSYNKNQAISWVRIIVVRRYYGDRILRTHQRKFSYSRPKLNQLSRKITAENLYRVVRMISRKVNPYATKISTAQATLDNACSKTSYVIKQFFKKRFPSVIISASLKHLLSPSTIRKLLLASKCPTRKIDVSFCRRNAKYRSIDGTCNNLRSRLYGSSSSAFTRLLPAKYYDPDGMKDPLGFPSLPNAPDVPNPLYITKKFVIPHNKPLPGRKVHSRFLTLWGQFLDHDFTLSPESEGADICGRAGCQGRSKDYEPPCFTILPYKSSRCIHFTRTAAVCKSNTYKLTTREQMNANTAFIDGSQIYGSTLELANKLRDFSPNKGLLRVRSSPHGDLLPLDTSELLFPNNLCLKLGGCSMAGDMRSSEQIALASIHTLFVREHNRIARGLLKINPHWNGDKIYQETRKILGGVLQKITYEDFLQETLRYRPLPRYTGYKYWVNPGTINSVAAAAFRFGHSTIRPFFDIVDEYYRPVGAPIPLKHAFFNNTFINRYGIESILLGVCAFAAEKVDRNIANGLFNHLFERRNSPGLNLIALNIQRGRDHGLPGYNNFRKYCRMSDAKSFNDTTKEISERNRHILAKLYNDDPSIADLWVAGIAETPLPGAILGPIFSCLIRKQFIRFRDGDRFFYRKGGVFSISQLKEIRKSSLSRILCDNLKTEGRMTVQTQIFRAVNYGTRRVPCSKISGINLNKWKDLTA